LLPQIEAAFGVAAEKASAIGNLLNLIYFKLDAIKTEWKSSTTGQSQ